MKGNKIRETPNESTSVVIEALFKFSVSQTQYSKDVLNNNLPERTSGGFDLNNLLK